jgi:hypothetical protein
VNIHGKMRKKHPDQHGKYCQIPEQHKHKKVVSIIRNPISRYVSGYHYRWWIKYPPGPMEKIKARFPSFPEIEFREYYYLMQEISAPDRIAPLPLSIELGDLSVLFIEFYYPDPKIIFENIDEDFIKNDALKQLPDISFLHQENLNAEMKEVLTGMGYSQKEVKSIDQLGRVNVTDKQNKAVEKDPIDYFDDEMLADIIHRERLLFSIFPEYLPDNSQRDLCKAKHQPRIAPKKA